MPTTGLQECPWCGDEGTPIACELQTRPTSYAVVCENCGGQGPRGDTFALANDEWNERAIESSPEENTALDAALSSLLDHARVTTENLAATQVNVERAVALGALAAVVRVLEGLVAR